MGKEYGRSDRPLRNRALGQQWRFGNVHPANRARPAGDQRGRRGRRFLIWSADAIIICEEEVWWPRRWSQHQVIFAWTKFKISICMHFQVIRPFFQKLNDPNYPIGIFSCCYCSVSKGERSVYRGSFTSPAPSLLVIFSFCSLSSCLFLFSSSSRMTKI